MSTLNRETKFGAVLLAGVSLLACVPAHAQTEAAASAAPADGDGSALSEIVVTGEKSQTTIQAAPLAISAIGSADLKQRNLNQVADLNGYVPGLTVAPVRGSRTVASIRGIGYETANNPNSQPGVAFHIDGVYISHVTALGQDFIDVDRIEVLRGPQGTVFGQTSTGGAINVITKKPTLDGYHVDATLSIGNYDYVKAGIGINVPITDTLAVRGYYQRFKHDGYSKATKVSGYPDGYDLDDANNHAGRVSILWKPNDTFTAEVSGQMYSTNRHGFAQKSITDPDPDPRQVSQDLAAKYRMKANMLYVNLAQDLGAFATIKTTTAWEYMDKIQSAENDLGYGSYYDHLNYWQDKSTSFTQEVNLTSQPGGSLDWIVGGFYLRQHALQKIDERSSTPASTSSTFPSDLKYATDSPYQHTSIAGFGQATYHATDALSVIAGLRYSWDKTTAQPYNFYGLFGLVAPRQTTSDALTGKLSAEYKLTPTNMVYVTASKGYKPNGLNFNNSPQVVKTSFQKETVWAGEIGTKNDFFGRKLTFNAAAYYYWYDNYQFASEDPKPNQSGTTNIPHAEIYGVEFESSAAPVSWVRFDGMLALSHGRFKGDFYTIDAQTAAAVRSSYSPTSSSDPTVIAAVAASQINTNGGKIPKLPGVQGRFSTSFFARVGGGNLTVRGEVVYRGGFSVRVFDTAALDRVPAYTIANGYVEWKPDNSRLTFSVSGNNLFDTAGVASIFTDPNGSLRTSREYIAPRQVFGTIAYAF